MLAPVLFIVYIYNFYTRISSNVDKFTVDTKIGKVIYSDQDARVLFDELDGLYD